MIEDARKFRVRPGKTLHSCKARKSCRLIDVGLGEDKGVAQQFQARLFLCCDDHFDDIKTKQNLGVVEQTQPRQATPRDALLLFAADRSERASELFACARFHFDENERVAVATDNVDFAAAPSAKVAVENLVAILPQKSRGQPFPARPQPEMLRVRTRKPAAPPVRKSGDGSDKVRAHGVS